MKYSLLFFRTTATILLLLYSINVHGRFVNHRFESNTTSPQQSPRAAEHDVSPLPVLEGEAIETIQQNQHRDEVRKPSESRGLATAETPPVIKGVSYWPHPQRKLRKIGVAVGSNFTEDCVLRIAGIRVPIIKIEPDRIHFEIRHPLPRNRVSVVASNGSFTSKPYRIDGRSEGFVLRRRNLDRMLISKPQHLNPAEVKLELESIQQRLVPAPLSFPALDETSGMKPRSPWREQVGLFTTQIVEAMKRLRILQGAICASMSSGEPSHVKNSDAAGILTSTTDKLANLASRSLPTVWSQIPLSALRRDRTKDLNIAVAANDMKTLVDARYLPWCSCKGKFYTGKDGTVVEAIEIVKEDLERPFREAMLSGLKQLLESAQSEKQLRTELKHIFSPVHGYSRAYWTDLILQQYREREKTQPDVGPAPTDLESNHL